MLIFMRRKGNVSGPSKARRGLGMIDAFLTVIVMISLGTIVGNVVNFWVERQTSQAEARALSAWADAGETFLLQHRHLLVAGSSPRNITRQVGYPSGFARSRTGPCGSRGVPHTPYRNRCIEIWYKVGADGSATVLAVASFAPSQHPYGVPTPVPGEGIVGVGNVGEGKYEKRVAGAGFRLSLSEWLRADPQLAKTGDLAAWRYISVKTANNAYLHRVFDPARPELNRMETGLDMGGHDIANVSTVSAKHVRASAIGGSVVVEKNLEIGGALSVEGNITAGGVIDTENIWVNGSVMARRVNADTINTIHANAKRLEIGTGGCSGC